MAEVILAPFPSLAILPTPVFGAGRSPRGVGYNEPDGREPANWQRARGEGIRRRKAKAKRRKKATPMGRF